MGLILFPALDLRQGRVVRLRRGDPHAQTTYSDDPAETAVRWANQGARWLHVVNLDGALTRSAPSTAPRPFGAGSTQDGPVLYGAGSAQDGPVLSGADPAQDGPVLDGAGSAQDAPVLSGAGCGDRLPINLRRLADIRAAVALPIQYGGGLRSLDDIALALETGATRVVLGTVAVQQPALVGQAVERFGAARIVVGLDAREGRVATHGWQETSELTAVEVARRMADLGVLRTVYTDISRDGMLTGVNVAATAELARASGLRTIASGGVGSLDDVAAVAAAAGAGAEASIEGLIIGQALYTGAFTLAEALALTEER